MANDHFSLGKDCLISPTAKIGEGVTIGARAILDGDGICIQANVRIDAGCIIGENVIVGLGAWIQAGAVVLQSVPANAIVQGNPAQVIGYRTTSTQDSKVTTRLIDYNSLGYIEDRPCRIPLEVGRASLYLMRKVTDSRGSLSVGEVPTEVPFIPQRYFIVNNVPSSELRGEHAHKECEQFLLCMNGSVRLLLDDGSKRCEVILDRPEMGVYISPMIWGTQYRYSRDAALLVFASMHYDSNDYIREYEDFIVSCASLES